MLIGAQGVGKTLLFNQFLSASEDREANHLGALIESTRSFHVDNEEYLLELLECEEFGYVLFLCIYLSSIQMSIIFVITFSSYHDEQTFHHISSISLLILIFNLVYLQVWK